MSVPDESRSSTLNRLPSSPSSGSVGASDHGATPSTSTNVVIANATKSPAGIAKKNSPPPSPSSGSVGTSDHGATPSPSTAVVVATSAPVFGTTVAPAAAAGWGSSPVSFQSKITFDQTHALPEDLLEEFVTQGYLSVKKQLKEGLPTETFKSLTLYSGEDYLINREIRENGWESLSLTDSIKCESILVAMKALPLFTSDIYYVYRAIQVDTQEGALLFKNLMETDKPFVDPAFVSTTLRHILSEDMQNFNDKNCYFAILSKMGRHILQAMVINEEELEVLFRPGTHFRILSFEDTMPDKEHGTGPDQKGRYRIVMKEI